MTPKDIREALREYTAPYRGKVQPTDLRLNRYLEQGLYEMCELASPHALRKTDTTNTLTADSAGPYFWPADLMTPIAVLVSDGSTGWEKLTKVREEDLDELDADWEDSNNTSSGSDYYYEAGVHTTNDANYGKRTFKLYPAPTSTVASGIKLRYYRRPLKVADMTSDETEIADVPLQYHEALVNYCAWKLLSAMGSAPGDVVERFRMLYLERAEHFRAAEDEFRQRDYSPEFRNITAQKSRSFWDGY